MQKDKRRDLPVNNICYATAGQFRVNSGLYGMPPPYASLPHGSGKIVHPALAVLRHILREGLRLHLRVSLHLFAADVPRGALVAETAGCAFAVSACRKLSGEALECSTPGKSANFGLQI